MSQTEADRFVRDMKNNPELQAEVNVAIAEIVKIAMARGYSVVEEDVRGMYRFPKAGAHRGGGGSRSYIRRA